MKKLLCALLALLLAMSAGGLAEGAKPLPAELDAQLRANLQARIDEILTTETEIVKSDERIPGKTYTGTAYYVSPNGNDEWDGLTPQTAKQTLKWVMEVSQGKFEQILEPGDAVFFERGGLYRYNLSEDLFFLKVPDITYSAYGEGTKPILTPSYISGVGAEKWNLVYEDETGVKIWQFFQDMEDIGSVILNDEIIADRVYEWWTGDGYESCEATVMQGETDLGVVLKGELLPLQDSLTEDYKIISRPDLSNKPEEDWIDSQYKGPLYLRCDAGNPGEIYESVEFAPSTLHSFMALFASGLVFDNLNFRYAGQKFMTNGMSDYSELRNTTIQNCEFAFCGTSVVKYETYDNGAHFISTYADGLYGLYNDTVFSNNYYHDTYSACAGFEGYDGEPCLGNLQVLNNVMVNTGGVRLDTNSENLQHFESIIIRGNQIWNTKAMDNGNYGYGEGSILMLPWHYGEYIIEDNVLYGTVGGAYSNALINSAVPNHEEYSIVQYSGNTYVQYAGRDFAYLNWAGGNIPIDDPDLVEHARDWMDEDSGTFYVIGTQDAASFASAPAPDAVEIEDSWDDILAAIDDGSARERYPVGATKALDLGGFGTIRMQLAGFDLDDRADGSGKAATTWIALDLLDDQVMNDSFLSAGGWKDSNLRAVLQGDVYGALPENVRGRLVTVKKRQLLGDEWQETEDALWIPDDHELFGADSLYFGLFGNNYESRVRYWSTGDNVRWWLRSAYNDDHFRFVGSTGSRGYNHVSNEAFVVLGFCL